MARKHRFSIVVMLGAAVVAGFVALSRSVQLGVASKPAPTALVWAGPPSLAASKYSCAANSRRCRRRHRRRGRSRPDPRRPVSCTSVRPLRPSRSCTATTASTASRVTAGRSGGGGRR